LPDEVFVTEFIELLRVWIEAIILQLGYVGIAFLMFVENIFPPIPSEPVMIFSGFLVHSGELNLVGILIAGTIGSLLGAYVLYYLGSWADEHIIRAWLNKYGRYFSLKISDLDNALGYFEKYGQSIILIGRMIPVVRSLISIPAGIDHMNLKKFTLYTLVGTLGWNMLLSYAGVMMGSNWEAVLHIIDRYEYFTILGLVTVFVLFFVARLYKMRSRKFAPAKSAQLSKTSSYPTRNENQYD
jgi:membrane protein DedA with SNARE-associated domain